MKKVLCGFTFGLVLMVAGAQAWADGNGPFPPPNPKLLVISHVPVLADSNGPHPKPPNPK